MSNLSHRSLRQPGLWESGGAFFRSENTVCRRIPTGEYPYPHEREIWPRKRHVWLGCFQQGAVSCPWLHLRGVALLPPLAFLSSPSSERKSMILGKHTHTHKPINTQQLWPRMVWPNMIKYLDCADEGTEAPACCTLARICSSP